MRTTVLLYVATVSALGQSGAARADEALASSPAIISDAAALGTDGPVAAVRAKDLIGRHVTGRQDVAVGEIESVHVDGQGNVREIIVAVGGVDGHGIAIPWRDVVVSDSGRKLAIDMTRDQLTSMPAHAYAKPSQQGTVFTDDP